MKRSPLQRRTPLRRTPWDRAQARLKSDPKPLRPVSNKRRRRFVEYGSVREKVFARDGYLCRLAQYARDGEAPPCRGRLTFHHRRKASAGGAFSEANGLSLCQAHNEAVENYPSWARKFGTWLVVREGDSEWESLGERNNR